MIIYGEQNVQNFHKALVDNESIFILGSEFKILSMDIDTSEINSPCVSRANVYLVNVISTPPN